MAAVVKHKNQLAARMLQNMTRRLMRRRTGSTIKTQRMIIVVGYQEEPSLRRRDISGGEEEVTYRFDPGSGTFFIFCITSRSKPKEASCFS